MRKAFILTAAAIMVFLTGCSKDEAVNLSDHEKDKSTVISLTASMPDNENPAATRLALEQEGLNIKLAWETGDKIYLVFTEGGTPKGKQIITLSEGDITNEGKNARFDIVIPPEITSETFGLYGVYGATGFAGENSYNLTLSPTPWIGTTLTEIKNKKVVMLRFVANNISKAKPEAKVTFDHLGSLFRIVLNNTSENDLNGITKAELIAGSTINIMQSQSSSVYSPVYNSFVEVSSNTSIPFEINQTNLAAGNSLELWGWYPIRVNVSWPGFGLKIATTEGTLASINAKPGRTSGAARGKTFHFYATYDGNDLQFTNSSGTADAGYIFDLRDNNVYKTVTIGTQTWMAQNLAYLPTVNIPGMNSPITPHYYVYGNFDPILPIAKNTYNYKTYGVLYNWPAALMGACPQGWHLPSEAEWIQLETYLADNGYNYDGSTGYVVPEGAGAKIGKALASDTDWLFDTNLGSIGNTDFPSYRNKSGFTALPAGVNNSAFRGVGELASWWVSTELNLDFALSSQQHYYSGSTFMSGDFKLNGLSVRCIKDRIK